MPVGWYDDSETTDESDEDSEGEASGDVNDEASGSEASEDNDEASGGDDDTDDNDSQQAEANQDQEQDQEPVSRRVVYSDSFPEPYSVVEDQMRDIRGSPGNIRVFNYWRQPGQSHLPLPPPPQNEDLRESLNRV